MFLADRGDGGLVLLIVIIIIWIILAYLEKIILCVRKFLRFVKRVLIGFFKILFEIFFKIPFKVLFGFARVLIYVVCLLYRIIKGLIVFYLKRKERIEQQKKEFDDAVFQAYILTKDGNSEGWKQLDWLKYKHGKRRVNNALRRMCKWPCFYEPDPHQDD